MTTENKPELLIEVSENYHEYKVAEGASEVDGVHILAKASGPAFFPDKKSGNNVFYPRKIWDEILSDQSVLEKLDARTTYGTIGHDIVIDDATLRDGIASHITTKMWIDEDTGIGMAEYLILNTKVGRILNTLLRAGSKLKVSTKAKGLFSPRRRQDGSKELTKYFFERVDFVITPGFKDALPEIQESLNSDEIEILQSLLTDSNENRSIDHAEANQMSEKHLELLQSNLDAKTEENTRLKGVNESLQKELDAYKALGTVAEIEESLDAADDKIEELTQSNTNVNESLVKTQGELETLKAELQSINESKQVVPEDVQESLNELEKYRQLGTPDELSQVMDVQEKLAELGTLEEITALVETSEAEVQAKFDEQVALIAAAASVEESAVKILADNCNNNLTEVAEMLQVSEKLNKPAKVEESKSRLSTSKLRGVVVKDKEDVNENLQTQNRFQKSGLANRLMPAVGK